MQVSIEDSLQKLGDEVDRSLWGMTPQTINAYYDPANNEIVFPAAILQSPFYNPDAEDAVNIGAIGFVIAHEISHAFDANGSKYDEYGTTMNGGHRKKRRNTMNCHSLSLIITANMKLWVCL